MSAILGGGTWLLLVPAAELHRRELLGYDGYNRLLAIPLLLFLVALLAASRALTVAGRSVRAGFLTAAVGVGLLLAGNVAEFYGVLLQDQPNAHAATQAGETDHWVGSDIGWIAYAIGMLVLLVGGLTAAAAMLLHRVRPTWVIAFTATLGCRRPGRQPVRTPSVAPERARAGCLRRRMDRLRSPHPPGRHLTIGLAFRGWEGLKGTHPHARRSDHSDHSSGTTVVATQAVTVCAASRTATRSVRRAARRFTGSCIGHERAGPPAQSRPHREPRGALPVLARR